LRQKHQVEAKEKEREYYRRQLSRSTTPTSSLLSPSPRSQDDDFLESVDQGNVPTSQPALPNHFSPGKTPRSDRERKTLSLQAQLELILNPVQGVTFHPSPDGSTLSLVRPPSAPRHKISSRPQTARDAPPKLPPNSSLGVAHRNSADLESPLPAAMKRNSRSRRWRQPEQALSSRGRCESADGHINEDKDNLQAPMIPMKEVATQPSGFNMRAGSSSDHASVPNFHLKEKMMFDQLMQQRKQVKYPTLSELLKPGPQTGNPKDVVDAEPKIDHPTRSETRKDELWSRFQSSLKTQPNDPKSNSDEA